MHVNGETSLQSTTRTSFSVSGFRSNLARLPTPLHSSDKQGTFRGRLQYELFQLTIQGRDDSEAFYVWRHRPGASSVLRARARRLLCISAPLLPPLFLSPSRSPYLDSQQPCQRPENSTSPAILGQAGAQAGTQAGPQAPITMCSLSTYFPLVPTRV